MFSQILYTQLKWSRAALVSFAVLAFVMPAGLWRMAHDSYYGDFAPLAVMRGFETLGPALGLLAFFAGFLLAALPWGVDAAANHVYPLSLPIAWPRYVAMRFGAGALFLLIPTVTLWLGSLLVLSLITLPDTLHAYPGTLALRFLLGGLLSYAVMFMVAHVTGRRAAYVLLGFMFTLVFVWSAFEFTGNRDVGASVLTWLLEWPGPLAVFGSDWLLVDV